MLCVSEDEFSLLMEQSEKQTATIAAVKRHSDRFVDAVTRPLNFSLLQVPEATAKVEGRPKDTESDASGRLKDIKEREKYRLLEVKLDNG